MGDKTLNERVRELEEAVVCLTAALEAHIEVYRGAMDTLINSVVLVEKRKPGPAEKTVKRLIKKGPRGGLSRKGPKIRRGFIPPEVI